MKRKILFLILAMFMFGGIAKAELQQVPNPNVTITLTLNEIQPTHIPGSDTCWYGETEMCSRAAAARMTVTIKNDMNEPLETYKIYLSGSNIYIAPTGSNYNWLLHQIKYDNAVNQYYIDESYTDQVVEQNWYNTSTETIPANSTVKLTGDFWVFTDDENMSTTTQNLFTYEEVDTSANNNDTGNQTGNENATTGQTGENNDLDGSHEIGTGETGTVVYVIKYEGGKNAKEGTMEDTPVYEGTPTTIAKNKYKNDKLVFAGWKVYIEDAEGKRTVVKVEGKELILKDGEELPSIDVPEGCNIVLAAQWTRNPNTGATITLTLIVLGLMALCLYFFQTSKIKRISQI